MRASRILLSCAVLAVIGTMNPAASADKAELHSAVKPVPRAGRWMKRHDSMNARVSKGNVDLVFIGDSITQGWEGRGKNVWKKYYGKRNAVNLGIGGDRTQHVIWRLDHGNLKGITPKVAVIMIGTNNAGSNSPKEISDGVAAIVKQIRTKSPKTKILLLATFPRGKDVNDRRRKVNEASNKICQKLSDGKFVQYVDIGQNFLDKEGGLSRKIMPDLLHLSQDGYEIWAKSIEPNLEKLLKETK